MERKHAFEILNLPPDASLETAKKAFRALAKQHHPDKAGSDMGRQKSAETRMKEIILAYRCLAPHLNSGASDAFAGDLSRDKPPESQTVSFWGEVAKQWRKFWQDKGAIAPRKKKTPYKKPKDTARNPAGQETPQPFDEIFKTVYPSDKMPPAPRRRLKQERTGKQIAYNRYRRYMALKRKMKSAARFQNGELAIGRVEKITPVTPVERVSK